MPQISGMLRIVQKPATIQFRRVSTSSTGDRYANDFKSPHKEKTSGFKSSESGGQATSTNPPTRKLSIQVPADNETEMCGTATMHEVQFSTNDQWHIGQEIRHVVFQGSFVISPHTLIWKHVGFK
jgi:hypothetical protein